MQPVQFPQQNTPLRMHCLEGWQLAGENACFLDISAIEIPKQESLPREFHQSNKIFAFKLI